MKAFFIFNESSFRDDRLIPLISAFADIDSMGVCEDLLEAVDAVRQRYPDAAIFDVGILDQEPYLFSPVVNGRKAPLVILPENYQIREKCTYVGVDFSAGDHHSRDWLVRSVKKMIREYHGQDIV
jgi:hypothetical protein